MRVILLLISWVSALLLKVTLSEILDPSTYKLVGAVKGSIFKILEFRLAIVYLNLEASVGRG